MKYYVPYHIEEAKASDHNLQHKLEQLQEARDGKLYDKLIRWGLDSERLLDSGTFNLLTSRDIEFAAVRWFEVRVPLY